MPKIVIIGGGPAGYEAALVAVELGADVTLVESQGLGGACVLTDAVPSKALISTSGALTALGQTRALGVTAEVDPAAWQVNAPRVFDRILGLARSQSHDIGVRLRREGVRVLPGHGRLLRGPAVALRPEEGEDVELPADVVLLASGAVPRVLPGLVPDGCRVLTWRQLYALPALPEHLVVIGSGVTGAEFASAFQALGTQVTLVSSRQRVLPGEDADAAAVLEEVFTRRGITVVKGARARQVQAHADGVTVLLEDARVLTGSHVLLAIGSEPATAELGLAEAGVQTTAGGFVRVDRVSRTSVPGVYAAGDVTGVLMLASVAAMQGRIAMWHALGEAVSPMRLDTVAANVFTDPEIATVGVSQADVDGGRVMARVVKLDLATNARAKMDGLTDGFVKLYARAGSGGVLGGVVVAPRASELVLAISLAVSHGLTVDALAHTFAVYPSLSGSITEAARLLMTEDLRVRAAPTAG